MPHKLTVPTLLLRRLTKLKKLLLSRAARLSNASYQASNSNTRLAELYEVAPEEQKFINVGLL